MPLLAPPAVAQRSNSRPVPGSGATRAEAIARLGAPRSMPVGTVSATALVLLILAGLLMLPAVAPPSGPASPRPRRSLHAGRAHGRCARTRRARPASLRHAGGDRAAEYVGQGLRDAGLPQVWEEHATTYQWEATSWGVEVGGRTIDAFPATQSFFGENRATGPAKFSTGPDGRTAGMVDVGSGSVVDLATKDVRGKVVLFDLDFLAPMLALGAVSEWLYDPRYTLIKEPASLMQGNPYITRTTRPPSVSCSAAGRRVRRRARDYFDSNRYRNEFYRRLNVMLPGFWVTAAQGKSLRQQLRLGQRQATLKARGSALGRPDPHGDGLTCPARSDETVDGAVAPRLPRPRRRRGCHRHGLGCSLRPATGPRSRSRPGARSLLFITFDSHFTGYQAHIAFGKRYFEGDAPFPIVANAHHRATSPSRGVLRRGKLVVRDTPEPRGIFRLAAPR